MTTKARVTHMGGNGAVRVRIMSGGTEITRHLLNAEGESHDFFIHGSQNLEVQEGVHVAPTVLVDEATTEDVPVDDESKGEAPVAPLGGLTAAQYEAEQQAASAISDATDSIVASAEAEATPPPAADSDTKQADTNEA